MCPYADSAYVVSASSWAPRAHHSGAMNQALPQPTQPARTFSQLLSPTPRGARLARLLTVTELQSWDAPHDLTERAELVVSELAANAVLHGRVAGRDFRLALAYAPPTEHLRIGVTDARGDRRPELPPYEPAPLGDGGRGLLLIAALADHLDCVPYPPSGKTVRAKLSAMRSSPTPQPLMEHAFTPEGAEDVRFPGAAVSAIRSPQRPYSSGSKSSYGSCCAGAEPAPSSPDDASRAARSSAQAAAQARRPAMAGASSP